MKKQLFLIFLISCLLHADNHNDPIKGIQELRETFAQEKNEWSAFAQEWDAKRNDIKRSFMKDNVAWTNDLLEKDNEITDKDYQEGLALHQDYRKKMSNHYEKRYAAAEKIKQKYEKKYQVYSNYSKRTDICKKK